MNREARQGSLVVGGLVAFPEAETHSVRRDNNSRRNKICQKRLVIPAGTGIQRPRKNDVSPHLRWELFCRAMCANRLGAALLGLMNINIAPGNNI